MKKLVSLFVVAGMLFMACNNNKPVEPEVMEEEMVEDTLVEEEIIEDTVVAEEPVAEPTKATKKSTTPKVQTIKKANVENSKKVEVNTNNKSTGSFQKSTNVEVSNSNDAKKVEVKTNNVTNVGAVKVNANTSEEPAEVTIQGGKKFEIK